MADSKLSTTTGSLNSRESRDSPNIKCDGGGSKNKNLDNGHKGGTPKKRKMNHSHQPMAQNSSANSGYNSNFNGQQHQGHRLTGSPAWDLPPQNSSSQTFTGLGFVLFCFENFLNLFILLGRCRLFVANLPQSVTEESLRKLFAEFGQIADIYIGKGNQFAFVKMDTRNNAEAAKNNLDGYNLEGRTLRVRLAAHAAAVKVTNLPPCVTNELLFFTFSTFGPIERAIVVADDRGRSLNEGIVEFVRKSSAQAAIKKCQNECLLLSATPIPAVVTSLESRDEEEGVPEKNISHTLEYRKEREIGPRFAEIGTVEYEISKKWKNLAQIEAQRREAFEAEMKDMHENFQTQMEYFKLEESTKQLREQLRQMESQAQQMNAGRDARFEYERQREEQRRQHENMLRAQEEQLIGPPASQPDMNTLRRQESDLRQQANALQQLLDRQESALRQMNPHVDSGHVRSEPL